MPRSTHSTHSVDHGQRAHGHAMEAKRGVFLAQDEAVLIEDSECRGEVLQLLADARSRLEAVDRVLTGAGLARRPKRRETARKGRRA